MYAAAGGASLASRQARQKQRQNRLKNQKATTPSVPKLQQTKPYLADYTGPRLSRVERGALKPPSLHPERRHSTLSNRLHASKAAIRESPSILLPVQQPLTPTTLVENHFPHSPTYGRFPHSRCPSQQLLDPEAGAERPLERTCSIVRQHQAGDPFEPATKPEWETSPPAFPHSESCFFGSWEYPFSECSQGRAAWQERERERRCSLTEAAHNHRLKQVEAHHRWMKRNRIHDTSYGGSSEEEDFFSLYHQSAAANALLYVGLGTTAIGLVIAFVGTGEKGFKTVELRLIGPSLIAIGLLCCLVRVLLCACPSKCVRRRKKTRLKSICPHGGGRSRGREEAAAGGGGAAGGGRQKKRVSIAPHPCTSAYEPADGDQPQASSHHHHHHHHHPPHHHHHPHHLQQQQQQQPQQLQLQQPPPMPMPIPIPVITLPSYSDLNSEGPTSLRPANDGDDSLIELQNLDMSSFEVSSISSGDSGDVEQATTAAGVAGASKLTRTRLPALSVQHHRQELQLQPQVAETDLSVLQPTEVAVPHAEIVLSPAKLER